MKDIKIGFTDKPFPVLKGSETNASTYCIQWGSFKVYVTIYSCKLELNGCSPFSGITSSRTSLKFDGWGQHGHYDEAQIIRKAVDMYCEENNLTLIGTYNNWPTFRGSVNLLES